MAVADEVLNDITTVALAFVGLATLAILVSRNANTSGVINSASSAYNTGLATAEAPVTGYSPGPPIYSGGSGLGLGALGNLAEIGSGFNTSLTA